MNLEDVLRETPMETLERVRQRLKQEGTSNNAKGTLLRPGFGNSTGPTRVSNVLTDNIPPMPEMDLATILEAAGVDTTKMSYAAVSIDQPERDKEKKSILTLSSLEYTANAFPFMDADSVDESVMHLTAIPIKKPTPKRRSTIPATRSFTSLGMAVSEVLKNVSLKGPQMYFQAYTTLKPSNISISDCVEDNL
ncbi:Hypothetical protein GLP15_608 [Giardia lamblia P15]|uniref:Uncharacterized protein n=1 Tax=Giardia intestinalis (strain P15) TaxID=658858 RepID=E1F575_GIAIA|nr:Hypothetical protein GLP15_608 [Giardia lamblia P15]